MDESILTSIKKLIGIGENDTTFDTDVIMHINSILSILTQLGVGSKQGFTLTSTQDKWTDFLDESDDQRFNLVKSYVYLRVRLLFDPPANSFTQDAIKKQYEEMEWRITVIGDEIKKERM